MGEVFYVDPPGYELFEPSYMLSKKDEDFNTPGMRYYHLWDTFPTRFGKPSEFG